MSEETRAGKEHIFLPHKTQSCVVMFVVLSVVFVCGLIYKIDINMCLGIHSVMFVRDQICIK